MKQVMRMSIDIEIELDCGDITKDDLQVVNEIKGFEVFDNKGVLTQRGLEEEEKIYTNCIREELELLDYKVIKIHNFDLKLEQ